MDPLLKKILKIISVLIVIYFLCDTVPDIDVRSSKNTIFTIQKKAAVDKMTDITEVKYKANEYIDELERIHEQRSSAAILNMNVLIILLCIVVYLNYHNKDH